MHRNLINAVINSLKQIFEENRYADRVIEKTLRENPKWGARDRKFIAETTYDIVRWWRLLSFCSELEVDPEKHIEKIIRTWFLLKKEKIPEWMNDGLSTEKILSRRKEAEMIRAIRESIPDWLDQLGEKELGAKWDRELNALNQTANLALRTNLLKVSRSRLIEELKRQEVDAIATAQNEEGVIVRKRINVFRLDAFKEGWFEVQDISSQHVAPFCEAGAGMRVIDACAGGGGKSLHLAALMENKGQIISLDSEEWKLQEVRKRARRAGANNIETRRIENTKVLKRLHSSADRVLLDVPCSGIGVLKRNPDSKWKLSAEVMERTKKLQQEILNSYYKMVKPGGKLIYATCSILPSENNLQVENFLKNHPDFLREEEKTLFPSEGYDGFYMVRMKREK